MSFPLLECIGTGCIEANITVPFLGLIRFLCFCSVQNKLLSKGLSHTHPPSSPSCLPSSDPAATSSPSTVDSISPARKVVVLNNRPLPPPTPCTFRDVPLLRSTCADEHLELGLAEMKVCKILHSSPGLGFSLGLDPTTQQHR